MRRVTTQQQRNRAGSASQVKHILYSVGRGHGTRQRNRGIAHPHYHVATQSDIIAEYVLILGQGEAQFTTHLVITRPQQASSCQHAMQWFGKCRGGLRLGHPVAEHQQAHRQGRGIVALSQVPEADCISVVFRELRTQSEYRCNVRGVHTDRRKA